ncbi:MAG: hypothetical protein QF561_02275 [Phycisphaerales bacterium]|jgi:hypothetical protein|nr:hypothetical protein [Phycisphaerales bacterium]
MMSRFATTSSKPVTDVFTAMTGIAALILILGCLWLIFHNLEFSASGEGRTDGGVFKILD